jgi:predicted transposase/invertase (TIGR01784 family)
MGKRRLVTLDWALKRLLRSKANFEILEGFLSELLKEDITILEVLESEANQESAQHKFNRLDIKVKNHKQELLLIEIQYDREWDYFQRMLYATSKAVTEHMVKSAAYNKVAKVISVNILHFDLGHGDDYIYHGRTEFRGLHKHDALQLNAQQKELFAGKNEPYELFPEYYLLKINQFDGVAKDTLDEWIQFLKTEEISDDCQAKGLRKAKEVLDIMHLSPSERAAYDYYQEDLHYQASMYDSSYGLGCLEGRKEGRQEGLQEGLQKGLQEGLEQGLQAGREEEKRNLVRNLKAMGMLSISQIASAAGLTEEEVGLL